MFSVLVRSDLVQRGYFVEAIPYLKSALEYLDVERRKATLVVRGTTYAQAVVTGRL